MIKTSADLWGEGLWRYLAPNWLRKRPISRLLKRCEIPLVERRCVWMQKTHTCVQSFCVKFGNRSQHAAGLYDNRVMRASRNFPLSSIFSSITAERDMHLHIWFYDMMINVHVCVLASGRNEGIWHQTDRNDGKTARESDRSVSVAQLMSNNLSVNIAWLMKPVLWQNGHP